MNKPQKKDLVPALRFPKFRDTGKWKMIRLGEISDRITEKVADRKLTTVSITAGYGFVSQAEKFSRDISGQQYENYILLKKGELSYNKGNSKRFPQGCIYKLKEFDEVAAPNAFISFKFKNNYVANFYSGYFDNNAHGKQLARYITSGARSDGLLNIRAENFFSIVLPTPIEKEEQQKIADCLSSLDDLITAETQKLAALKIHKKGLMQQLFPAEGETVPRLRFPEFRDAGEWEEKKLIELTTKISDGIHTTPIYDEDGEYFFINGNNLANGKIVTDEKTKRVGFAEFNKHKKPIDESSILMSINGTIGNLAFFGNERVILGKSACFINIDQRLANKTFIYYMLQTDRVMSAFASELTGSTIKNLSLGAIRNLAIPFPLLPEQQKIADCLSSVDELITAQSEKVEALKLHKKGLMQQLFPVMEEVDA